jgi:hypothetical protein
MVAAVDYRHVDRQMGEPFGGVKAGKPSAHDEHAGTVSRRRTRSGSGVALNLLDRIAHAAPLPESAPSLCL